MAAFYLDEDAPESLALLLTALDYAVTTTRGARRKGSPDYDQLWYAALNGWTLVTLNRKDYQLLHGAWHRWAVARQHAGILVAPHVPSRHLADLAAAIDAVATDPNITLSNALYAWTAASGWQTSSIQNH
jgi:hypothetical protein